MSNPCVTEGSAIIATLVMLVASGVPTENVSAYPTAVGAEVITRPGSFKQVGWRITVIT
jgi:hypothetical protein